MLNLLHVTSAADMWLLAAAYVAVILVLARSIGFGMANDDDQDGEDRT